jgi:hypothetical protein
LRLQREDQSLAVKRGTISQTSIDGAEDVLDPE